MWENLFYIVTIWIPNMFGFQMVDLCLDFESFGYQMTLEYQTILFGNQMLGLFETVCLVLRWIRILSIWYLDIPCINKNSQIKHFFGCFGYSIILGGPKKGYIWRLECIGIDHFKWKYTKPLMYALVPLNIKYWICPRLLNQPQSKKQVKLMHSWVIMSQHKFNR